MHRCHHVIVPRYVLQRICVFAVFASFCKEGGGSGQIRLCLGPSGSTSNPGHAVSHWDLGLNFPIFSSTMAVNVFHTDARDFGLLSSIMAIGTISGTLIAAGRDKPKLGSLFISSAGFGIRCSLAARTPGYWWFATALVITGVAALTLTHATETA